MKSYIIILISILASNYLYGQNRLSSKVYFNSGEETIEGILVRPNNNKKTPAVVFQQGSGNHSFEGYETEAWGPHKFYIEDVLLEQGYAVLYCNKRGLGKSTGNWKKNSFYGLQIQTSFRWGLSFLVVIFKATMPNRAGCR